LTFLLHTPVVFMIFNRPDTTLRIFAEIAKAKPTKLLVIGDGARGNRAGEAEKVIATRAVIDQVDWPCQVLTNYSEVNLGCKNRISSGLDWAFSNVDQAIILEDDCLPDQSFFRYCQEMLEYYRDDLRIGMINGTNLLFGRHAIPSSYYFSQFGHVWGWASWSNRWQNDYDVKIEKWGALRTTKWLEEKLASNLDIEGRRKGFDAVFEGTLDTWDVQLDFALLMADRLAIAPSVNLIRNIGFNRADATHTTGINIGADIASKPMIFPLNHPANVVIDHSADTCEIDNMKRRPLTMTVRRKLKAIRKMFKRYSFLK
jgi:hypothetical protein